MLEQCVKDIKLHVGINQRDFNISIFSSDKEIVAQEMEKSILSHNGEDKGVA
jgi:hypothetical protein